MKPLVIFYSFCIIGLYSVLTFIGYRKEKFGNINGGVLAEVTVTASAYKTAESKLLSQHFDNTLKYLKEKNKSKAAEQMYDALMVFTLRAISSGNYDKNEFWLIIKELSDCYINIELNRPLNFSKIDKIFESTELFLAEGFVLKSSSDIRKNNFPNAITDINRAEESIVLAAKYSNSHEVELQKRIFNSSVNLLNNIIKERESEKISSRWKKALRRMDNLEGAS